MIQYKSSNLQFIQQTKVAGFWIFPGSVKPYTGFAVTQKPNWFHILTMRVLLGWKWSNESIIND